uniref:Uncharacterized protein n=1 Tax=Panagrolaimus sp. PS1159 TaxID=55785 RepID=A0AC35FZS3_9BILA
MLALFKLFRDRNFKNRWLDLLVVFLTFTAGLPICKHLNVTQQWRVIVILNFCGWFNLLNLVKKLPRFGVYVLMVRKFLKKGNLIKLS